MGEKMDFGRTRLGKKIDQLVVYTFLPKMADETLQGVYYYVFWRSCQLLQDKFFDPSTPSMRYVDVGGKICCSEGLYAAQRGYMLFRRVIWMFRKFCTFA